MSKYIIEVNEDEPDLPFSSEAWCPDLEMGIPEEMLRRLERYEEPKKPEGKANPDIQPFDREQILDFAKAVVTGERVDQYGQPEKSFGTIAELWSDYLSASFDRSLDIGGIDVALMMVLLKVASRLRAVSSTTTSTLPGMRPAPGRWKRKSDEQEERAQAPGAEHPQG
jgi:hypothetical protein